jgi:hypothetical protein
MFGPVMAALDEIEGIRPGPPPATRRPLHDGLLTWTAHAQGMYQRAFPLDNGLALIRTPWIYRVSLRTPDRRGAIRYEITAWGRQLASLDGRVRELRLLVTKGDRHRTDAERSVAALVAAEGGPGPLPEHVRVLQVNLLDARIEPLFEGSRDEARALFEAHGKRELEKAVDSTEYRPGSACIKCSYISVCPALARAPGLLGINDRQQPRRSWSPSNGRTYQICPARDQLRRFNLPVEWGIEHSPTADRGRAVHDFLAYRHGSEPQQRCTAQIPAGWIDARYSLPDAEQLLGMQLLQYHVAVCPLRHARLGSVRVEPSLTFYDEDADVTVVTKPDLLYQDGDSWVWREVKTRLREGRWSSDLLEGNPQLALAVLLVGRGELGGSHARARVELEVLHPGGADLEIIDPFTPSIRKVAETVLLDHVRDWHIDNTAAPRPGPECVRCEVARWCTARIVDGAAE